MGVFTQKTGVPSEKWLFLTIFESEEMISSCWKTIFKREAAVSWHGEMNFRHEAAAGWRGFFIASPEEMACALGKMIFAGEELIGAGGAGTIRRAQERTAPRLRRGARAAHDAESDRERFMPFRCGT